MFIEAKKLIGLPVAAIDTQSKIGAITEVLVEPETGKLLGFLVQADGIFAPKKVLSAIDVRNWDPKGIVTESIENLVSKDEIVRVKEVLDKKMFLIGIQAKTVSGKNLGKVEDLLIDIETQTVAKFYLKDLLGNKRILTADQVSKIDKYVIFLDQVAEPPEGAVGAPAG